MTGTADADPFLGDGGGILAYGNVVGCNTLTLTNDTISGNTASVNGGGYYGTACVGSTPGYGPTALLFDTFAGNSEGSAGGGNLQTDDDTVFTMGETILASGTTGGGTNCDIAGTSTLTSKGYNLDDGTSCHLTGTGDISTKCGLPGYPRRQRRTDRHRLPAASGSPAIGAIPDSVCAARGATRRARGRPALGCDLPHLHDRRCPGAVHGYGSANPDAADPDSADAHPHEWVLGDRL